MTMFHKLLELGFSLSLFANAVLFIPQAVRIYKEKDSKGVSLITFIGFLVFQMLTILHGFLRNDYLLAYGMLLSAVTCSVVIFFIVYYKAGQKERVRHN